MNNSYITIIKEKRTALSRKRIPLNQNGCTANFRIGVPFEQNLHTKVDIRNKLLSFSDTISEKTINHTVEIFSKCGKENCFGRTIVEEITGLKPSRASKLIKLLVDSEVIVPVTGHGKGKYRFQ